MNQITRMLIVLVILGAQSLADAKDWRVPNFPNPDVKEYRMRRAGGCNPKGLFNQMKADVDSILPDLAGVYNFGLAVDTTDSQGPNIYILSQWIDFIYSSVPQNAMVAFSVVDYGDSFREGFLFTGDKNYSISRVKAFLLSRKIYGGGDLAEDVNGGSYYASKNLKRQHGLIFNVTNASDSNSTVKVGQTKRPYTLRDLGGQAAEQIHVIRNVYFSCI